MDVSRRDARLAKTIEAALPRAVPASDYIAMLRQFVASYVADGMVADVAVHLGKNNNPHVHVLLTVNRLEPDGFSSKIANADRKSFVTQARAGWEKVCNAFLAKHGSALRLDRRSFKARGLADKPSTHRGPHAGRRARDHAPQRSEVAMPDRPTLEDRQDFPLLSRRPDWPPGSERPSPDMSFGERQELIRFWEQRRGAEEAGRDQFREHRVVDRFLAEHAERLALVLEPARAIDPEATRQPGHEPARAFDASEDFRFAERDEAYYEERRAYDRELWGRAVNLNRTRQETELLTAAERISPLEREAMKEHLLQLRIERLRQQDAQRSRDEYAAKLSPELREQFVDHVGYHDWNRYPEPEPGPYGRPERTVDLNRARSDMLEDYERDLPDPDEERKREPDR